MNLYDLIFYIFAFATIASAFFVVVTKNIIYAAFSLLLTLFSIAGIFVLLGADFLSIIQLIVYVGGIVILILFGVMLTNKITNVPLKTETTFILPATIILGIFSGLLIAIIINTDWATVNNQLSNSGKNSFMPTAKDLGFLLMNQYVIYFELLGMILLIALIGAASIARKK
ncbi:MAG: NADH-quinone oxidoreductase subunit J [Ignavibacterium sp.]